MSNEQPIEQDAQVSSQAKGTTSQFDIKTALAGAAIAVLVMAPVTYGLMQHAQQQLEQRLADAPPVAVLDFTSAVATFAQSGGTSEDVERMVQGVDSTVRKLSAAGFLVLDSKAVLSAPKSLYVPQSMILGIDADSSVTRALSEEGGQSQVAGATQNLLQPK